MLTIDGRCGCERCESRTGNIYRMVASCLNCGARPLLVIFRAGDPSSDQDCPVCGNWRSVKTQRLATKDEIPEAIVEGVQ